MGNAERQWVGIGEGEEEFFFGLSSKRLWASDFRGKAPSASLQRALEGRRWLLLWLAILSHPGAAM